jgi:LysM repeat protein
MRKKALPLIFSLVLISLLLAGCKMPASRAPEEAEEVLMTTPIVIVTEAPVIAPEETEALPGEPGTEATEDPFEDFFADPTATPEPTIAVPTLTRPAEYTLRDGEFPFCIARRFDLDPATLLSINNIAPNTLVEPGTTLQIPQTGSWTGSDRARNPHPTTHTVRAGETIYAIACFYGDVSPEAIIAVNQLEAPYTLTTGQTLDIP